MSRFQKKSENAKKNEKRLTGEKGNPNLKTVLSLVVLMKRLLGMT